MLRMRETAAEQKDAGAGGTCLFGSAGKYEGREVIRASLKRRIFRRESFICLLISE